MIIALRKHKQSYQLNFNPMTCIIIFVSLPLNFPRNKLLSVCGQFNGSRFCFTLILKYELINNPSLSVLISAPAETILAINMSLRN